MSFQSFNLSAMLLDMDINLYRLIEFDITIIDSDYTKSIKLTGIKKSNYVSGYVQVAKAVIIFNKERGSIPIDLYLLFKDISENHKRIKYGIEESANACSIYLPEYSEYMLEVNDIINRFRKLKVYV